MTVTTVPGYRLSTDAMNAIGNGVSHMDNTWHEGDEVSVYSIGYGRRFPGVVTEVHPEDGAWVKTTTRPDGPSTTWYPTRYLTRSEAKAMQEGGE